MSTIKTIGIENVINAMNAYYKKNKRSGSFLEMEQKIAEQGTPEELYLIAKGVEGIDIELFAHQIAKRAHLNGVEEREFEYVKKYFTEFEGVDKNILVQKINGLTSTYKLKWMLENLKSANWEPIFDKLIAQGAFDKLLTCTEGFPEKNQEFLKSFLIRNPAEFAESVYLQLLPLYGRLENIDVALIENKIYKILDQYQFSEKAIPVFARIKGIDYNKFAHTILERNDISELKELYKVNHSAPALNSKTDITEEQIIDAILEHPRFWQGYKFLSAFDKSAIDYLYKKMQDCEVLEEKVKLAEGLLIVEDSDCLSSKIIKDCFNIILEHSTNAPFLCDIIENNKFKEQVTREEVESRLLSIITDEEKYYFNLEGYAHTARGSNEFNIKIHKALLERCKKFPENCKPAVLVLHAAIYLPSNIEKSQIADDIAHTLAPMENPASLEFLVQELGHKMNINTIKFIYKEYCKYEDSSYAEKLLEKYPFAADDDSDDDLGAMIDLLSK